jgi:hypothetical protein
MANVGDHVEATTKSGPRSGVVTGVSGRMVTVRWSTGEETSLIPGPGVLTVLTGARARAAAKKAAVKKAAVKRAPAKKAPAK